MLFRALGKIIRNYPWYFIAIQLSITLQTFSEMSIPILIQKLISHHGNYLGTFFGLIFLAATLALVFAFSAWFLSSKMISKFREQLQADLYDRVQALSWSDYEVFSPSSLIRRTTTNTKELIDWLRILVRIVTRSLFMVVGGIITTLVLVTNTQFQNNGSKTNTTPVLVAIFSFILISFIVLLSLSLHVKKRFNVIQNNTDKYVNQIQETVLGIRFIKVYQLENHKLAEMHENTDKLAKRTIIASLIEAFSFPIINFFASCIYIVILWLGAQFLNISQVTALTQTTFYIVLGILFSSFFISNLGRANSSAKRVFELLLFKTSTNPLKIKPFIGDNYDLSFDHVTFTYPDHKKPSLNNLSFTIPQGSTIGIIGKTGSGKSTILRLITNLYQVENGQITIGNQSIDQFDPSELAKIITIVPQKNNLFSGTILSNIQFGNTQISEQQAWSVLKTACADDFFTSLDYPVEQHGQNLSGGQKQRLCIARALARSCPILILDDATSALDYQTEQKLLTNLKKYHPDQTKIIVAQKISSIWHADAILVLDQGNLIAQGTHQELMITCDIYREIYQIQNQH